MTEKTEKSFNRRAFISILAGFSFLLMALTGLVLFIAPSCRVARDTSWTVWGQSKEQWIAVHVWLSIVFVVASVFHLYLNWMPMVNYFKAKVRKGFAFRMEWILALAICAAIYAGTICNAAPFSSLITWKESFKHGSSAAGTHGRGWRGGRMAAQQELSHQGSCESSVPNHSSCSGCEESENGTCDKNLEHSTATAESVHDETCEHEGIQGLRRGRGGFGMGQKTLKQFCTEEGIELSMAITRLKNDGFTVRETMTMREIADSKWVHPRELRTILQPDH